MKFPVTFVSMVKGGSPDMSEWQLKRMQSFYNANEGKFVQITIRNQGKPRSLSQNAYYWGVIVQMIADEMGDEPDDVHEILKLECAGRKIVEKEWGKYEISISTTKLSTDEAEVYFEKCRIFAAKHLQMVIPLPHESI